MTYETMAIIFFLAIVLGSTSWQELKIWFSILYCILVITIGIPFIVLMLLIYAKII